MSVCILSNRRADFGPLALLVCTLAVASLCFAASAVAQSFDHMSCRAVIDGDKAKIKLNVEALDERFAEQKCRLGKARLLCERATRTSIDPAPELAAVEGDSLAGDFVCYKAKCPTRPQVDLVTDAFGTRRVGKLKSKLLCIPTV